MKEKTVRLINKVSDELETIKTPELRKSALLSKLNILKNTLPTSITTSALNSTQVMLDQMENVEVYNELTKFIYALENYIIFENGQVLDQSHEKKLIHDILHKYDLNELES